MKYANDPRRSFLVNGNQYRRALEQRRSAKAPPDTLTGSILAGLAVIAFIAAAGLWLGIFA